MIHYLGLSIISIKSMRWQREKKTRCWYESHARLTAFSVWSVSAFQENISRSKRNQSCWDGGGGISLCVCVCVWMEEFLQKGMASVHDAVPEGEDVNKLTVLTLHLSVLFRYVYKRLPSMAITGLFPVTQMLNWNKRSYMLQALFCTCIHKAYRACLLKGGENTGLEGIHKTIQMD